MNKNSILNILYQKMQNIHRCAVFNVYNDNKIKFKHRTNHSIVVSASDFQSKVSSSNLPRDLNLFIYLFPYVYVATLPIILVLIFPNNINS